MNLLIQIIAFMMIYAACDIGRKPDSELEFISWQKLLQMILVSTGVLLYSNYSTI